jgi:hypothetical protein
MQAIVFYGGGQEVRKITGGVDGKVGRDDLGELVIISQK